MDNNVSALAFHDRQCEKSYLDIESERLRVEIFKKIQRGNRVRDADHVGAKKKTRITIDKLRTIVVFGRRHSDDGLYVHIHRVQSQR